ncbi:MAG: glycosyltransferase family 4 protein [Gemmatimonadota bacterium]|nr:glycosyltransferase family 4 protein [Gemmatimonadota bacterium]
MTPLRVGIDAAALRRPESGIGRYTAGLIRGLSDSFPEDDLRAYVAGPARGVNDQLPIGVRLGSLPLPLRILPWTWRVLSWPGVEAVIGPVDVFHTSDWTHPPQRSGATVTTVHDLGPLDHPEWYEPRIAERHRVVNKITVGRAHRIIAVSEFTRDRLLHHYPEAEGRVVVVPSGVSPDFDPGPAPGDEGVAGLPRMPSRFLLYVGSAEPRKNLTGLLRIFRGVALQDPELFLVLAGLTGSRESQAIDGSASWTLDPVDRADLEGDVAERVVGLGLVTRSHLVTLYRRAEAFLFPTLYEGFGLPVLEAMATGCPVIASNRTAVPEVAAQAAVLADPSDEDAFAQAVLQVVSSRERQQALRLAGLARAGEFTWERTARETREVYLEAAEAG